MCGSLFIFEKLKCFKNKGIKQHQQYMMSGSDMNVLCSQQNKPKKVKKIKKLIVVDNEYPPLCLSETTSLLTPPSDVSLPPISKECVEGRIVPVLHDESGSISHTIINKGTGAGGSKTNHNGIAFEQKTDNEHRLILCGFVHKNIPGKEKQKYGYYLEKIDSEKTIHFVKQNGLKYYMAHFHQKELVREVDEAYIITNNVTQSITVKILEKKNQTGSGSVDDKLLVGTYFKFVEYPGCLGDKFKIEYAYCVSAFLKNQYTSGHLKWKINRESNEKYNIPVFYGDDETYFETLDAWLNSSL